jgi:hypothetical protein
VWGAPKGDESSTNSYIYAFTYDEVFAGCLDAIARLGAFVETQDKTKGRITGHGMHEEPGGYQRGKVNFEITINTVSGKPETRVTIVSTKKACGLGCGGINRRGATDFNEQVLGELQKVLATY